MAEYYTSSATPGTGSPGSSSPIRAEFLAIETALTARLPVLAGNGDQVVVVNSGGTGLTAASALNGISLGGVTPAAGAFTTLSATGAVTLVAGTIEAITIGAVTPSTGAFTTIDASGAVTFTTALTVANGGTGLATATAYAVLCGGTTGTGALQSIASVGTVGMVLTSNGAGALPTFQVIPSALVLGTPQATTSGTTKDFTIPAGVRRVVVSLDQVSIDATDAIIIRLGDSGGVKTSGYTGSASTLQASGVQSGLFTVGFGLLGAGAISASIIDGSVILSLLDSSNDIWIASWSGGFENAAATFNGGGRIALSGALTTVRLTSALPSNFNLGNVNVSYE